MRPPAPYGNNLHRQYQLYFNWAIELQVTVTILLLYIKEKIERQNSDTQEISETLFSSF